MKRHIVRVALASILGSAWLLAGCSSSKPAAAPQARTVPVETAVVKTDEIGGNVLLTGQVVSGLQTKVVPKQSGKVAKVFVHVGDTVTEGQPLAQLDTTDLEIQLRQQQAALQVAMAQLEKAKTDARTGYSQAASALEQAKAALTDAQANYDRTQKLFDANAASRQQLDTAALNLKNAQAKYDAALQQFEASNAGGNPLDQDQVKVASAQVNQAQANLASIQNQLNQATILSPVAGVVVSRDAEVGGYAGSQTPVATVAQLNPVKVNVNVPETLIGTVKPGLPVKVTVQVLGGRIFEAAVTRVSSVADNSLKAYPAEIEIQNPDGELKPGMVAQVQVNGIAPRQSVVIPADSLVQTPDGPKVFTVENNVAHQHLLRLGTVETNRVEVLEGLKAGDVLVTAGQELLGEGTPVRLVGGKQ